MAALNTVCPKCGATITPAQIRRIDFERIQCPECGEKFDAGKEKARQGLTGLGGGSNYELRE